MDHRHSVNSCKSLSSLSVISYIIFLQLSRQPIFHLTFISLSSPSDTISQIVSIIFNEATHNFLLTSHTGTSNIAPVTYLYRPIIFIDRARLKSCKTQGKWILGTPLERVEAGAIAPFVSASLIWPCLHS